MAYILIDGYNLIGIAHTDLEKARNSLIEKLRKYSDIKNHHITLVFDGWKSGQKDETRITSRNLTVIYSRLGEKADLTIKRKLSASTKPWIVVSSDREISDYAARKNFASISSDEFEEKLYSVLSGLKADASLYEKDIDKDSMKYADDNIDRPHAPRKGNPRKISKRHKKKIQALMKL